MENITTEKIELATQFVNSTSSHIFLTGKAGTGKTTFLHELFEATHKNFVIVAPTGVAALNAKGVTIHSQFLFPFGSFLVNDVSSFSSPPQGNFYTRHQLARKHPLNSIRKQVLRNIDLLVIDEVSMLRADLLDAIDYRLKSVKNNFQLPFGGVQLLVIGDLYQLPPIVKDYEWQQLKSVYASPHFFESLAWKKSNFVYIELDKIFRQQDDQFIGILNNIRNNSIQEEDIAALNAHYKENNDGEIISLTTHNYSADGINKQEMEKLPGKIFFFDAEIHDNFPEQLYPLPQKMELKVGAKVMFIKNDSETKAYYNGKLAEITKLSENEIYVDMEDTKGFKLGKYCWENKKYSIDPATKDIEEDIIGTFTQYPIKPAWAITVHKSQGLTFEKAKIDVGKAFAPGQVYVALSRLRSLDGLLLQTRISKSMISSDLEVVRFSESTQETSSLGTRLKVDQAFFMKNYLLKTFDFSEITDQIDFIQKKDVSKMEFEDVEMRTALCKLQKKMVEEKWVSRKYNQQIQGLIEDHAHEKLLERIEKGSRYYLSFLNDRLFEILLHLEEVKQLRRTKTYQNALNEIDQLLTKKVEQVQKAEYVCRCIIKNKKIKPNVKLQLDRQKHRRNIFDKIKDYVKENPKNLTTKSGQKRRKSTKGETHQITFSLLKKGMKPDEIAKKRGFATTTIEGHLAKGINTGDIRVEDLMEDSKFREIAVFFASNINSDLSYIFEKANKKYSFGMLRIVRAAMIKSMDKNEDQKGAIRQ